jgi:hypothetical protein
MNPGLTKAYNPEATVNPHRFVKAGSAVGSVIQGAANTDKIFGVSGAIVGTIGYPTDVIMSDIAQIELGGTVAAFDQLTSDSVGRGVELSSAMLALGAVRCGAIALEAGVVGDLIDAMICIQLVSRADGITSSVAEMNVLNGAPMDASFVVGAEGSNAINVAIQLKDADGADLAVRGSVRAYLSDDATGDSVIATATSGTVAIGTDGLLIDTGNVAKKCFQLTSESDGDIDITITEAGVKTLYLILVMPNGKLKASGAITFA